MWSKWSNHRWKGKFNNTHNRFSIQKQTIFNSWDFILSYLIFFWVSVKWDDREYKNLCFRLFLNWRERLGSCEDASQTKWTFVAILLSPTVSAETITLVDKYPCHATQWPTPLSETIVRSDQDLECVVSSESSEGRYPSSTSSVPSEISRSNIIWVSAMSGMEGQSSG